MEFNILIGGEAGQGAFSVELELTQLLTKLHYYFFATKNYMSRIRGGHNFHMIRVAEHPVHALSGQGWDMIVALDGETEERHKPDLRQGGRFLSQEMAKEMEKIARENFKNVRAANTILVGLVLSAIGSNAEDWERAGIRENLDYLKTGMDFSVKWKLAGFASLKPQAANPFNLDGNQAITIGALSGGCQFMSGYPMTPASSIMTYFSTAAQSLPVHFEQAEDEIAAINMALGSSYGGVRSMAATSGGGFALMQEGISLAGMTETPIVVVIAQRPAPATGFPTRTEQGDLDFVVHAGHGEFARIVFAPGAIPQAVELTAKAFQLADKYQIPVFIMTDQYFADSVQLMDEHIPLSAVHREYPVFDETYRRYKLTDDGISPLTYPGLSPALVKVDSDEHTEEGQITEDVNLRIRMVNKRLGKLDLIKKSDSTAPAFYGDDDATAIIICWGSNRLIVAEAIDRLRSEGRKAAMLHFSQVYPLTSAMIEPLALKEKKLICLENNAQGQFARLLKRELALDVQHRILKYNGESFTVDEVYRKLIDIL